MRQWVVANVDNDPATVYRKIYDELYNVIDKGSIPSEVLTIAEYQYKSAFVADQEINLVACLVELMLENVSSYDGNDTISQRLFWCFNLW